MAEDAFDKYLAEINKAYLRGDATEHTHRPALKGLIESLGSKITATNEPRRTKCGAPDLKISRRLKGIDATVGYVETKDIGTNLTQEAKSEQIKKRYLPGLHNFILTDYIEFRWYVDGEARLTARLANESQGGKFKLSDDGVEKVSELLEMFLSQEPEKITTAKDLAVRMAGIARLMREIINKTFAQEQETGTLHGQLQAFREVLIHDLTEEQFADMYAQTICYGLFSARCHIEDETLYGKDKYAAFHGMNGRPKEFTRINAAYLLPKTNPFLRKMFADIAGPDLDDRIAWLVDDLVALLQNSQMGLILQDFAKKLNRKDPVVHFYETFLAEYDPKLKKTRGVYYTPDEVVSYIVRSVDILLKEKFGLKRGFADDSKIKGSDLHKLLILDPAVGTGTFLFEVIDQICQKFKTQKGAWSGYVKDNLLPRLFGFELMMAPYAICHMKLGLQLAETGYDFSSDERLRIYLTNTLEEAEDISQFLGFARNLALEAQSANEVKRDLPIMVVLGNPPYSGLSANMNEWIEQLLKRKLPSENGAQSYYEIDGKPLGEKKVWLQDDYVKFIRFGQYRIEQTGNGILAFITNHSYLDNPTFRGMRQSLMQTFNEIYILDLHGNQKKKETCPDGSKDVNVFDIQQGVSIGIFIKEPSTNKHVKIYHADLYGLRKDKYNWLNENDIKNTNWKAVKPNSPYYFFLPKDESARGEYEKCFFTTDIMPINVTGIVTARDNFVIDFEDEPLLQRIKEFCDKTWSDSKVKEKFELSENYAWRVSQARKELQEFLKKESSNEHLKNILYRPFDIRKIFYHPSVVWRTREKMMQHMLRGENLAITIGRAGQVIDQQGNWNIIYCTRCMTEFNLYRRGGNNLFPLYLYPSGKDQTDLDYEKWPRGKDGRIPNLSREYIEELTEKIKLDFLTDDTGDLKKTFGPEDVFHYIYAVLHSPEYRKRYAEFLKIDFPRVPWPKDKKIFVELCRVGEQLTKLHLMEADILQDDRKWPKFNIKGSDIVENGYPKYVAHSDSPDEGKVYINKDQFFEGIRPEVWEFHIGGYQVCEKWLKDRRERPLSYDDINHYQKVVVALGETIRLMREKCLFEMFENKGS